MKTKHNVILLCVATVLLFASCGKIKPEDGSGTVHPQTTAAETPESTETAPPDTEVPSPVLIDVIRDQKSSFLWVYSQSEEADFKTVGTYVKYLRNQTGCMLRYTDDSMERSGKPEILYGKTNRQESAALYADIGEREYAAAVINGHIVLAGSDAYALSLAFSEFCQAASCETGLTVAENFSIRGSYSFDQSYPVAVTDQASLQITLFDLAKGNLGEDAVIQRFSAFSSVGYGAAGMRFREWKNGQKVMLAVAQRHAEMVDYETGTVLWEYTGDLIWNAHAIELLPNGVIAVAGSTGNNLTFFNSFDHTNANPVRLELADAHGVVWDPDHALLWACGGNWLRAFSVEIRDGVITAAEDPARAVSIPTGGAHDFQPIYGQKGMYWLSTSSELYCFHSGTGVLRTADLNGVERGNIKGIGSFADGVLVQTVATGSAASWNTDTVLLYLYNSYLDCYAKISLVSSAGAFYKLRVVSFSYQ